MSRIGKLPVKIPAGVTVQMNGLEMTVKGPKGELKKKFNPYVKITVEGDTITVTRENDTRLAHCLHGLTRTLINNMITGVTKGFSKQLEIIGVGFRGQAAKNKITLTLGFSHPVEFTAPNEIVFEFDKENKNLLTITGVDKEVVGQVASEIRGFKKPEPYKGKGIKYVDEHIVRKAGKTAAK